MEQHAVPQNITTFEFKLIGDMTLKQFGYLAAGSILAFIVYSTNWNPLAKFPLIIFWVTAGVSFAFIPIQERPLETWVVNFFRSVYKPTLFNWRKNDDKTLLMSQISMTSVVNLDLPSTKTQAENVTAPVPPAPSLSEYLDTLPQDAPPAQQFPQQNPQPMPTMQAGDGDNQTPISTTPGIDDLFKTRETLIKQEDEINRPEDLKPKEKEAIKKPLGPQTIDDLIKNREEIKASLPTSVRVEIRKDELTFDGPRHYTPRGTVSKAYSSAKNGSVQDITTLNITTPNLIIGTVKDQNGQIVPGVVVVTKNTDGVAVRALRTNKVGQFIASTPLDSGVYFLEFEKDGYEFDPVELVLDGRTIPPIEINGRAIS